MQINSFHLKYKLLALVLTFALLLPTVKKALHLLDDHSRHVVCVNNTTSHFHNISLDCDFSKYNSSNPFVTQFFSFKFVATLQTNNILSLSPNHLQNNKKHHFLLRAPPYNS